MQKPLTFFRKKIFNFFRKFLENFLEIFFKIFFKKILKFFFSNLKIFGESCFTGFFLFLFDVDRYAYVSITGIMYVAVFSYASYNNVNPYNLKLVTAVAGVRQKKYQKPSWNTIRSLFLWWNDTKPCKNFLFFIFRPSPIVSSTRWNWLRASSPSVEVRSGQMFFILRISRTSFTAVVEPLSSATPSTLLIG